MDYTQTLVELQKALGGSHTAGGMNILHTKLAVDLQNLDSESRDDCLSACVESIRVLANCDAACIALIGDDQNEIEQVVASSREFTACNPEVLLGQRLEDWQWLDSRLAHLRLLEIKDTSAPTRVQLETARRLDEMHVASMLAIGFDVCGRRGGFLALFRGQPASGIHAEDQLLLKLLGSSLASGLDRLETSERVARLQERNDLIAETANDGYWDFDATANRVEYSQRWRQIMGLGDDDQEPPDWRDLVHPDDLVRVQTRLRAHIAGDAESFDSIHRMRRADGEWRWVQSRARALRDDNNRLRRLVAVERDITEHREHEKALFREKESLETTLQSIGDGVVTTDNDALIEYMNPVAEQLTGWVAADAAGRPLADVFRGYHEETCEPIEDPLSIAMRQARAVKSVRPTLLIRRDGNEIYIESTASPIRNDRGAVAGGVLVFHDVSESRELNRRLSYHASHDVLTGLVNRREFEDRLDRALLSARAKEASYALCYLDLDQFKIVNDSCGHGAGDALLGQLGALLKSRIRWRDTLARLGGDEFGVLLEACSLGEAMRTADTLRETIQDYRFTWEGRNFHLGVSIGVVPITPESEDVAGLLSAADSACRAAKESGRNRIHSYQENDIDLMRRRREMQWAARINSALEESRFELFRQSILPLQDEQTGAHYELLLRMRDENGALISPDVFISAAERYGIMSNVDRWVVTNAFRWLVSAADERDRLSMCSINLSGQSIADDKFLPFVVEQFEHCGIDAAKICFEITETAAIASYSQANRFINALRELGCRFALDDFGTGLSSFGYLKHFPVDFLKIDGSFVKEILHDPIDREMVRSINEIGHLTGKRTIAEFVENPEVIAMLRGMGVDYAQGYGVAEPKSVFGGGNSNPLVRNL
jgi:diguanylate cyclase (GGDEF)-like protein/PAS domain S-box-containing protein